MLNDIVAMPPEVRAVNGPSIFRVPPNLRMVDSSVYDSKLISFGPYQRGNAAMEEMDEWKERYFTRFFNRTASPRPLELDVGLIDDLEEAARNSYAETINMNRQEFMEMMLRDGCFILEVLINPLDIVDSSLVVVDMFLIENQVPFIILQRLFELVPPNPHTDRLVDLARNFVELFLQVDLERPPNNPDNVAPLHLLDVLYSCMKANGLANNEVRVELNEEEEGMARSIPSARRLVEAGIKFKKTARGAPYKASFEKAVLEMSPLKIHDGMDTVLQNVIVFERYCLNERRVLDYMYLVNCLVNSIGDVKVLGKSGVLVNGLGSEEKVVDAVKRISRNFTWGYGSGNGYERLFLGVNRYCRSPWTKWKTHLVQVLNNTEYWAIIGIFLAIYGLCFTSIQTYYTVQGYYK